MKKTLALLLALTMVFALAACGGGSEKPPANSGDNQLMEDLQDAVGGNNSGGGNEQPDESTPAGDSATGWPSADFIPADAAYNGAGEIVHVEDSNADPARRMVSVYIQGADANEFFAYFDQLGGVGVEYLAMYAQLEPPTEASLDMGYATWRGVTADNSLGIEMTFTDEDTASVFSDGKLHNLSIHFYNYVEDFWLEEAQKAAQ